MSSDVMRRHQVKAIEGAQIPEHVIWRLKRKAADSPRRGCGLCRSETAGPRLAISVQHPTPEFQLLWSKVTSEEELNALARQHRQLFEAKGWTDASSTDGGGSPTR